MGAELLKFAGFFEKSNYLKDFQCPQCRQTISKHVINRKELSVMS